MSLMDEAGGRSSLGSASSARLAAIVATNFAPCKPGDSCAPASRLRDAIVSFSRPKVRAPSPAIAPSVNEVVRCLRALAPPPPAERAATKSRPVRRVSLASRWRSAPSSSQTPRTYPTRPPTQLGQPKSRLRLFVRFYTCINVQVYGSNRFCDEF